MENDGIEYLENKPHKIESEGKGRYHIKLYQEINSTLILFTRTSCDIALSKTTNKKTYTKKMSHLLS